MPAEPTIAISPKDDFRANKAGASAHSDHMASPAFKHAARMALLEYQYRVCPAEPTVLAIAASKLKGAQEFLAILLNLGLEDRPMTRAPASGLVPPEEALMRPWQDESAKSK